ncbi:MAG: head GIN domain-containing protein [Ferruginibacter sp.]
MNNKILLAALGLAVSFTATAQDRETITGSGKVETKTIIIKPFNEIKISGIFELVLSQGEESLKIEADDNLQQYFTVKNDGNKLVVDMEKMDHKNFKSSSKMKVYLSFKNLDAMDLKTIGNVSSNEPLKFDILKINSEAIGNIKLQVQAKKITVKNKGVGNITLTGNADDAEVSNSGVGSFAASDLVVQTMSIENSGIGSAHVNVVKSIQAKSTGMGSINNSGAAPLPKKKRTVVI